MKNIFLIFAATSVLAACGQNGIPDFRPAAQPVPETAPAEAGPTEEATPSEALPTSGRLGTTVASLGSPAEGAGLWLKTSLVTSERPGRVVGPSGSSANVTLQPIAGAAGSGSRLSIDAYRALGVPLTALPEVTVYAN